MAQIAWVSEMKEALSKAEKEKKPILLDFFNPA